MATILIVDDEPAIRAFVRAALEEAGHAVLEASDGPAALQTASRQLADLVLLDIALPHLSGTEVCRRLRQLPAAANMPVLLLTGLAAPDEGELARAGAQGCIAKPFSPAQLVSLVEAGLEGRPAPVR